MKIKKIYKRDLNSLYELGKEEFKQEFWFTKDFLEESLNRKGIFLGAFEKTKLIGAILIDISIDRPKAWIFFFIVKIGYRGQGIGHKLLENVEKKLPKEYYKLFVDFEKTDRLAIRFYKNHGFKKAGKVKDWFGNGTCGLIYSKTIKKQKTPKSYLFT